MLRYRPFHWSRPAAFAGCWFMPCLLMALLVMVSPATAQDRYRLGGGGWQQTAAPAADSPEGRLQTVRRTLAEDRAEAALELADAWIERYPGHSQLVDAYLIRGDAKAATGEYYQSLFDYEFVVRMYPSSEQYLVALDRELKIAKLFGSGMKRKFLGMRVLSAWGEAEELLIRIQERAPGSDIGEDASIALGDFYFERSNMPGAAEAYDLFLINYPTSPRREHAMRRLIEASLETYRGSDFDATGLIEAGQRIKRFQQEFPAAANRLEMADRLLQVYELLAASHLQTAQWYDRQQEWVSAAYAYRRILRDYPDTRAGQAAGERLAELPALSTPIDR